MFDFIRSCIDKRLNTKPLNKPKVESMSIPDAIYSGIPVSHIVDSIHRE